MYSYIIVDHDRSLANRFLTLVVVLLSLFLLLARIVRVVRLLTMFGTTMLTCSSVLTRKQESAVKLLSEVIYCTATKTQTMGRH